MPDRLGPYRLLDRIGEGGMGVVYLARDSEHRSVAIKVLRPSVAGDPNARRRLAREVETMRLVRSPFVAEVIDTDVTGNMPYIVTQYVPGRTLDEFVREEGPLRGAPLARLACGLAEALIAVHGAGVVHRDLKPGNVMLVNGQPVVIDFGIAQALDSTRLTMTGMFMGTPGYLSPEVIEGQQSSRASDVHAWGATVAFAATGRAPFGTGSYETIFYRIVNGSPDLVGVAAPMLPLLTAALGREPSRRPSAEQLSAAAAALDGSALMFPAARGAGPEMASAMTAAGTRLDGTPGWAPVAGAAAGADGIGAGGIGAGGSGAAGIAGAAGAAAAAAGGVAAAAGFAGPGLAGPGLAGPGLAGPGSTAAGFAGRGLSEAGPAGRLAAGPGTRPIPSAQARPSDYADMLPPVAYAPAGAVAGNGRAGTLSGRNWPAGSGPAPTAAGYAGAVQRRHPMLVLATMVIAVSVSVALPVAGTLLALAAIVLLRAGELAQRGVDQRRTARGARATDHLFAAAAFPWFLVRSVLASLLLAPLALAVAAGVGVVTLVTVPVDSMPRAVAYGAGTLVAFYGLGPGSGKSRRQLNRIFAAIIGTRTTEAVALIGLWALAVAALAAAASSPAAYWPLVAPTDLIRHVPGWNGISQIAHFRFWRPRLWHFRLW
ncbi:MAG TPA: serine/threonine-protein kinase [Streptosporangiaceae bacterium]